MSEAEVLTEESLAYSSRAEVLKSVVLGALIGLAIIVPGVSGAAIAIIFGLYGKLLFAGSKFFKDFKNCFKFLLPVLIGGVIGIIVGFLAVKKLIDVFPLALALTFCGLMVGSFPAVLKEIKGKSRTALYNVLFIFGLIIPVAAALLSIFLNPAQKDLNALKISDYIAFLPLGYVAAVTQIVPGLSATALLMIFGYFTPLMSAINLSLIKSPKLILVFALLAVGFFIGLFTFSKIMTKLLNKRKTAAFNLICGLSVGSAATMLINPELFAVYKGYGAAGFPLIEFIVGLVLFILSLILALKLTKIENSVEKI